MVTCVIRDFFLVFDGVDFFVRVIHKNVLGAFLHALDGAFAGAFMRGLGAAFAVRDVPSQAGIRAHCQGGGEKHCCTCCCKTYFHNSLLALLMRQPESGSSHRGYHTTFWAYSRGQKKGGFFGILPWLFCFRSGANRFCLSTTQKWKRWWSCRCPRTSAHSGIRKRCSWLLCL